MNAELQKDEVIAGRYRLVRPLGAGGVGVVWEAEQVGVGRRVAIKFLKSLGSEVLGKRFEKEAQAMARLNHPSCVTMYEFGVTDDEVAFLVMEFLEGESAESWRKRRLSIRDIVDIGKQVATALAYAHHNGVVHRDLKPENVFIVQDFDGSQRIKVLDFGLAKLSGWQEEDITKTGQALGTPGYMSPEQLRGSRDVGPRTDLYALGVILYELIEGRLPFWSDSPLATAMQHLTQPVPKMLRPDLDRRLENIVLTLLAKEPSDRFPSARDVCEALDAVDAPASDGTLGLVSIEIPAGVFANRGGTRQADRVPHSTPHANAGFHPLATPVPGNSSEGGPSWRTSGKVKDGTGEMAIRVSGSQEIEFDADTSGDYEPGLTVDERALEQRVRPQPQPPAPARRKQPNALAVGGVIFLIVVIALVFFVVALFLLAN